MKKIFFSLVCMAIAMTASAQNIQLHYDLGHSFYSDLRTRPNVTTTVEMFKPDKWGSTFLFTDIDYFSDGAAGAYWEIAREFNVTANKQWAVHVEYDGGATTIERTGIGNRFQHAFLAGGAWNWASKDFSKTFSLQAMYKYYFKLSTDSRRLPFGATPLQRDSAPSLASWMYGTTRMSVAS